MEALELVAAASPMCVAVEVGFTLVPATTDSSGGVWETVAPFITP